MESAPAGMSGILRSMRTKTPGKPANRQNHKILRAPEKTVILILRCSSYVPLQGCLLCSGNPQPAYFRSCAEGQCIQNRSNVRERRSERSVLQAHPESGTDAQPYSGDCDIIAFSITAHIRCRILTEAG